AIRLLVGAGELGEQRRDAPVPCRCKLTRPPLAPFGHRRSPRVRRPCVRDGYACIRRRHQAAGESLLMLKWATVPLVEHTTACRHRQCTRGAYFKKGARSPEGGQCFIARLAGPRFESWCAHD